MSAIYKHGVQAEVNRLKREVELYEKQLHRTDQIIQKIHVLLAFDHTGTAEIIKSLLSQL